MPPRYRVLMSPRLAKRIILCQTPPPKAQQMTSTSPKRKRVLVLPLDTKGPIPRLQSDGNLEECDDGSPRTKVARKFDNLDIDGRPTHEQYCSVSEEQAIGTDHTDSSTTLAEQNVEAASPKTNPNSRGEPKECLLIGPGLEKAPTQSTVRAGRSKSPPLKGEISDEFWHDSEITGHDPDDPNDDGYGINGIGFRPTAAIAWSRSQRRSRQLAECKNREAREARQQRSERRKRFISESGDALSTESSPRKSVRVHFEDG